MPNDVFRPRLPLDPFGPQPWRVALPQGSSTRPQEVILMLGAPSYVDLAPIATSSLLSNALLIIATHTPPPVPKPTSSPGPSVIVLRLPEPLHIHDSGAVRLVNLLDRASRVAHSWRTALLPQPRIQQLAELFPGGEFSISEEPELAAIPQPQQKPHTQRDPSSGSSNGEKEENSDDDSLSSISSTTSSRSSRFSSRSSVKQAKANSRNGTGQAQFSALINFLPPGLPDKSLLKHSVLVTTLSAPFLAPPTTSSPYGGTNKKRNRQSVLSSMSFTSLIGGSTTTSPTSSPNRSRSRLSTLFVGTPSAYDQSKSSPPSLRVTPSVESFVTSKVQENMKRAHLIHVLPYSASTRTTVLPLPPSHPLSHQRRRSRTYDSGLSSLHSQGTPGPSRGMTMAIPPKGKERVYEAAGPAVKSKLVQSIEQFLLSYAYPPSTSTSSSTSSLPLNPGMPNSAGAHNGSAHSTSPLSKSNAQAKRRSLLNGPPGGTPAVSIHQAPGSTTASDGQAIVPYVLPAGVLGSVPASTSIPNSSHQLPTIGELLLQGVMDKIAGGGAGADEDEPAFGGTVAPVDWPRAWIGRGAEVEIVSPGSGSNRISPVAEAYASPAAHSKQPFLAGGLPISAPPLSAVNSESMEPAHYASARAGAMVTVASGSSGSMTSSVIRSSPLSSGATTPVYDEPPTEIIPNPKRRSQVQFDGGRPIPRFGHGSRQSSAERHNVGYVSSSAPSSYVMSPPPPPPPSEKPVVVRGKGKGKEKQTLTVPLPTPPDSSSSLDGASSDGSHGSRSTRSSSSGGHEDDEVDTTKNVRGTRVTVPGQEEDNTATPIASRFTRGRTTSVTTPANGKLGLPTPGPSREPSRARSEMVHAHKGKRGLKEKLTSLFGGRSKKKAAASSS